MEAMMMLPGRAARGGGRLEMQRQCSSHRSHLPHACAEQQL
jgi:hypothetical protein